MTSKVKKRGEITGKLNLAKRVEAPLSEDERHCFSFRYLSMDVSVKKCDNKVFKKFVSRLKLLSEMI